MLLLLRGSYLSVVADRNEPDRLIVRARLRGHIERVFPQAYVIVRSNTQYRYRAFVQRDVFVKVLADQVESMQEGGTEWALDQAESTEPYRSAGVAMARAQAKEHFPAAWGDRLPAIRSDWKVLPMRAPIEWVPADIKLTREQLGCIRLGIKPEEMEDKWFFFFEEPWLYCVRSWTGEMPAAVRVEETADGARILGSRVSMNREVGRWDTPEEGASLAIEALGLCILGVWPSSVGESSPMDAVKLWAHHGQASVGELSGLGVPYEPEGK